MKRKIFQGYTFMVLILIIVLVFILNSNIKNDVDSLVIVTFILNGSICIISLLKDKYNFSLNKTFWYFNLFFFFLAPLMQYLTNCVLWEFKLNDEDYLNSNLIILLWYIVYNISFYTIKVNKKSNSEVININNTGLHKLLLFTIIAFFIMIALIGFKNLFIKKYNNLDFGIEFLNTIITNFLRSIPVFFCAYSIYYYRKYKKNLCYLFISFVLLFIINFPISITRYWIGAIYIGIFLTLFKKYIKYKRFDYIMIFIFLIAFPFFQIFKWYSLSDVFSENISIDIFSNAYNNVDFDAHNMLARALRYVADADIVYGKNIFSTLLFFIPRAIWNDKAIPTGEMIASYQNQSFTNLSCPLVAEGYVNFGIIGVILYAIIFARIVKIIDQMYWQEKCEICFIDMYYPFLIGFFIFLLRGSFHPVVVYMITFYLFLIMWKISKNLFRSTKEEIK